VYLINEKFRSADSISSWVLEETNTAEQRFLAAKPVIIGISELIYRQATRIKATATETTPEMIFFLVIRILLNNYIIIKII
jgi:hypothetical protein